MPDDMERMLRDMILISERIGCGLYVDKLRIAPETVELAKQKYIDYWAEYHYFFDFLDSPEFKDGRLTAKLDAIGMEDLRDPESSLLDLSIDDLQMSVRPTSCLKDADITFVGELVQKTPDELRKILRMGRWSIAQICEVLAEKGLFWGMQVKNWSPKRMIN